MSLPSIRRAMKCCLTYLEEVTDTNEHTFAILDCPGCSSQGLCRKLGSLVEKEINKYK